MHGWSCSLVMALVRLSKGQHCHGGCSYGESHADLCIQPTELLLAAMEIATANGIVGNRGSLWAVPGCRSQALWGLQSG